jgi:hypothetical protein
MCEGGGGYPIVQRGVTKAPEKNAFYSTVVEERVHISQIFTKALRKGDDHKIESGTA